MHGWGTVVGQQGCVCGWGTLNAYHCLHGLYPCLPPCYLLQYAPELPAPSSPVCLLGLPSQACPPLLPALSPTVSNCLPLPYCSHLPPPRGPPNTTLVQDMYQNCVPLPAPPPPSCCCLPALTCARPPLPPPAPPGELPLLQDMYQNWPFFQGTLDLVEMVLAKADVKISQMYDERLVQKELWHLGDMLRGRWVRGRGGVGVKGGGCAWR